MMPTPPQKLSENQPNLDEASRSQHQLTPPPGQLEPPLAILSDAPPRFENSLLGMSTLSLTRSVGYTLALFALVDLLYAVIPPRLTDPVWEFQTIGDWFERVPVLMLGLVLIFHHGPDWRYKLEKHVLRVSSWFSLMMAICFLLIIPLCANDAVKINRINNAEINVQLNEQSLQLEQTRNRIQGASEAELSSLLLPDSEASEIEDAPRTVQAAKDLALEEVSNAETQSKNKANQARQNLKRNLFKNTLRLMLGCIVSAITFTIIWKNTAWARDFSSYRNAKKPSASSRSDKKTVLRGKKWRTSGKKSQRR